jgi:hypothetical protein
MREPARGLRTAAAALVLLLLAAPLRAAADEPDPVPGAVRDEKAYEDRVLGFRVEHPPAPWKPLPWTIDWAGPLQSVVAYTDPTGALLAVCARDAAGLGLQDNAFRIALSLELAVPRADAMEAAQVGGDAAIVFTSAGKGERRPINARVTVVLKEGVCYALCAWADGKQRLPALAKVLEERFRFLDAGEFRTKEGPPDAEGPGWRLRGGTAEHAFVGVRMPVCAGWRIGAKQTIPKTVALPSMSLECVMLGVEVRLQGVPREEQPWEEIEAAAELDFDLRYQSIKGGTPLSVEMEGRPVDLTWRVAKGRPGGPAATKQYVLCGTLRGDGRLVMIELLHPAMPDPRVPVAVRDVLERVHVLAAEERAALAADLAALPDGQALVAPGAFVRNGAFVHYGHRIVWRKPSPLWSFVPGEPEPGGLDVLAALKDEARYTNARLMFFVPQSTDTKWVLHERVVQVLTHIGLGTATGKPRAASLGSRDAVRSDFRGKFGEIPLRYTLLTTNPIAKKCYALIVVARDEPGADAAVEQAIRGLRFQVEEIPGPRRTTRGWEDPGHGFRVDVPSGPFATATPPVVFAPAGGTVVTVEAGDEKVVVASSVWPRGEPALEKDAVARALALLDPAGVAAGRFAAGEDVPGTLGGTASKDRAYAGTPTIRVSRVRRAGILYVVAASAPGREPAGTSWFRFTE